MPRTMKAEDSLAARYPGVAATWHPDRNGPQTPENTTAKNGFQAWWRCAAGHEWKEGVSTRTALPRWKRGDRAACRLCVGFHVVVNGPTSSSRLVSSDELVCTSPGAGPAVPAA
jgi:hypothetical protein